MRWSVLVLLACSYLTRARGTAAMRYRTGQIARRCEPPLLHSEAGIRSLLSKNVGQGKFCQCAKLSARYWHKRLRLDHHRAQCSGHRIVAAPAHFIDLNNFIDLCNHPLCRCPSTGRAFQNVRSTSLNRPCVRVAMEGIAIAHEEDCTSSTAPGSSDLIFEEAFFFEVPVPNDLRLVLSLCDQVLTPPCFNFVHGFTLVTATGVPEQSFCRCYASPPEIIRTQMVPHDNTRFTKVWHHRDLGHPI